MCTCLLLSQEVPTRRDLARGQNGRGIFVRRISRTHCPLCTYRKVKVDEPNFVNIPCKYARSIHIVVLFSLHMKSKKKRETNPYRPTHRAHKNHGARQPMNTQKFRRAIDTGHTSTLTLSNCLQTHPRCESLARYVNSICFVLLSKHRAELLEASWGNC